MTLLRSRECSQKCLTVFLFAMLLYGCRGDPKYAETKLEEYLEIDIPSEFSILEHFDRGIMDFQRYYSLQFNQRNFQNILDRLDPLDFVVYKNRKTGKYTLLIMQIDESEHMRIRITLDKENFRIKLDERFD